MSGEGGKRTSRRTLRHSSDIETLHVAAHSNIDRTLAPQQTIIRLQTYLGPSRHHKGIVHTDTRNRVHTCTPVVEGQEGLVRGQAKCRGQVATTGLGVAAPRMSSCTTIQPRQQLSTRTKHNTLPFALSCSALLIKPGAWSLLQVGVKAPGTAKITTCGSTGVCQVLKRTENALVKGGILSCMSLHACPSLRMCLLALLLHVCWSVWCVQRTRARASACSTGLTWPLRTLTDTHTFLPAVSSSVVTSLQSVCFSLALGICQKGSRKSRSTAELAQVICG